MQEKFNVKTPSARERAKLEAKREAERAARRKEREQLIRDEDSRRRSRRLAASY